MSLQYKQFACKMLTLIMWLGVAYGLYFYHIATPEIQTTESRAVKTANDAFEVLDDTYTSEWTTEQNTAVTTENSTFLSTVLQQPTKTFIPGSVSINPNSTRSITPNPVTVKLDEVKLNSSAAVTSMPVPAKPTKDPMDVYSDMGGIVIKPSNSSTPVNPHPFHYTLNPEKTCDVGPSNDLFLLVYVHTRPESIKQREVIRSTWGDVRNYEVTVRRIFVMGLPGGEYVQEAVKLESNLYRDIVQENFLDTYRNLTYKAVGALRWVKDYCGNAKFVLKTDDDAFVNMHILLDLLVSKHKARAYGPRSFICNVWYNSPVARDGKWAVTLAQRKHPRWPNFCQGLAYIITPSVAADLFNASFDVPFLWMDDVYVTGFLAKKIGMVHTQFTNRFFTEEQIDAQMKNPDLWKNVLFSHIHNNDRRRWAWSRVMKLRNNSSTPTTITIDKPCLHIANSTTAVVPTSPSFSNTSST